MLWEPFFCLSIRCICTEKNWLHRHYKSFSIFVVFQDHSRLIYTRFRQRSPLSGNIVRSPETCPRKLPVYIVLPWFQPAFVAAAACVLIFSADKIIPMKRSRLRQCCVVPGCSLRSGTNLLSEVRTLCVPRDECRSSAWLAAIKRENWTPTKSAQICSAHFIKGK